MIGALVLSPAVRRSIAVRQSGREGAGRRGAGGEGGWVRQIVFVLGREMFLGRREEEEEEEEEDGEREGDKVLLRVMEEGLKGRSKGAARAWDARDKIGMRKICIVFASDR